jgi:2,3-bisphosphoglycerate-dependent phosphoglycerate mutase
MLTFRCKSINMSRYKTLLISFMLFFSIGIKAQKQQFIIIRHAEKDISLAGAQMMQSDPPLNAMGMARANSLIDKLKKYPIQKIYSTNFKRTMSTALPIANAKGLNIETYDPRNLKAFATTLKSNDHPATILIVGHSNTSPRLVNLLIGQEDFKDLDESNYYTYWIVTTNGKKTKATMLNY